MGRRRIKDSSLISCEREGELKVIERWGKDKRWCKLKDNEDRKYSLNMGRIKDNEN